MEAGKDQVCSSRIVGTGTQRFRVKHGSTTEELDVPFGDGCYKLGQAASMCDSELVTHENGFRAYRVPNTDIRRPDGTVKKIIMWEIAALP